MNLPATWQNNTLRKSRGFTLLEMIIVVGLIGMVLFSSSLLDLNYYSRELKISEVSVLVSVLQKARNQAMNNLGAKAHGVYLGNPSSYILFHGSSYDPLASDNESIPRNPNISLISTFDSVTFAQLSGNSSEVGDITLGDGIQNHTITLESNGLIDW